MDVAAPHDTARATRLAGFFYALGAGALWGTTGPLSTALYAAGATLTGIGFWRILLGTLGLIAYGMFHPGFFRIDRRGLLLAPVVTPGLAGPGCGGVRQTRSADAG